MELYSFDEAQSGKLRITAFYFRKQECWKTWHIRGFVNCWRHCRSRAKRFWSLPVSGGIRLYLPKHFKLDSYMLIFAVPRWMVPRSDKADVIAYAVQKHRLPVERCVMIGDRRHDIIGGKKNGMRTIVVLYGYGSREELKEAGADCIVEDVQSLLDVLKKGGS